MNKQWMVMRCDDCEYDFAIQERVPYQLCSKCGSEEVEDTGEYLSSQLYTEDGKEI